MILVAVDESLIGAEYFFSGSNVDEKFLVLGDGFDKEAVNGRRVLYVGVSGMDWISLSIPCTSSSSSACSSLKGAAVREVDLSEGLWLSASGEQGYRYFWRLIGFIFFNLRFIC